SGRTTRASIRCNRERWSHGCKRPARAQPYCCARAPPVGTDLAPPSRSRLNKRQMFTHFCLVNSAFRRIIRNRAGDVFGRPIQSFSGGIGRQCLNTQNETYLTSSADRGCEPVQQWTDFNGARIGGTFLTCRELTCPINDPADILSAIANQGHNTAL